MQIECVEICCLKRQGDKSKKHKVIPLENNKEVTIGRGVDMTVCILSNMISRKHAILQQSKTGSWTVTDNKSLNGVFLNGQKLKPGCRAVLKEGDLVQLGVPTATDKPPEFVWKFFPKLRVKKILGNRDEIDSFSSQQSDVGDAAAENSRKRQRDCSADKQANLTDLQASPSCSPRGKMPATDWTPSVDIKRKLAEQEQKAQEILQEKEKQLAQLQALLQEKDDKQKEMLEELKEKEQKMQGDLERQQEELEAKRQVFEEEMKQAYEEQIKEKEESLLERLSSEKAQLLEDKQKLEERLQTEMKAKLGEKDKELEAELLKQQQDLQKVIEQKELKQKLLESELSETKTENQKQKEEALRTKEDILSNFSDMLETELQCSICNELFIQATSLNCSHSYCALCIEEWMKVKKECPVCRSPITSHIRSIVLDSYIDRMVEHLSEEMKEKRKELVAERKAEMAKREADKAAAAAGPSGRGARGAARGRQRGGRTRGGRTRGGRARRGRAAAIIVDTDSEGDNPAPLTDAPTDIGMEVVISSEEAHSNDSYDSLSEEQSSDYSIDGDSDAPYGGYGSCYRCGHRGHWAPGCPFYNY